MTELNNNDITFFDPNPEANLTSLNHLLREFDADYSDINVLAEITPELRGDGPPPEMTFVDKKADLTFYEERPGTPRHGTNEKTETFFGENLSKVKRKHSQQDLPKSAKKRLDKDDKISNVIEMKIRDLRKEELRGNHPTFKDLKPLAEVITGRIPPR